MRRLTLCTLVLLFAARLAFAEDTFFSIAIDKLTLTEGKLPDATKDDGNGQYTQASEAMRPYAVLDAEGEAYPFAPTGPTGTWTPAGPVPTTLAIRVARGSDTGGKLFLPKSDG